MYKKLLLTGVLMLSMSAMAASKPNTKKLNAEFEKDIKYLSGSKRAIKFPKLAGADFGKLEKNKTPFYMKNIVYKYNQNPPANLKKFLEQETKSIVKKKITIGKFVKYLKQLEQKFVKLGYPMVRVVFTAQKLASKNAVPRVDIISGSVERIVVHNKDKKVSRNVKLAIYNILNPLRSKKYLSTKTINEKTAILKGIYGIDSSLFLSRGKKEGGFIVNVKTSHRPSHITVSVKNALDSSFGSLSFQAKASKNFLVKGISQNVYAITGLSAKQTSEIFYRSVTAGYSSYFSNGSTLSLSNSLSDTGTKPSGLKATSFSNSTNVSYKMPYILGHMHQLYFAGGFNYSQDDFQYVETKNYIHSDTISEIYFNTNYTATLSGDTHSADVNLYQTLGLFGAKYKTVDGIRPSRTHADANRFRLQGMYSFVRKLSKRDSVQLAFNMQYTFGQSVLSSQQFSATGGQAVQGLVGNSLSGDAGYSVFAKYTLPPFKKNSVVLIPHLSSAYGQVTRYNPTATEQDLSRAVSVTLGTHLYVGNSVFLEMGLNQSRKIDFESVTDTSITFSVSKSF